MSGWFGPITKSSITWKLSLFNLMMKLDCHGGAELMHQYCASSNDSLYKLALLCSALIFTGWDCSTLIWHNVVEFVCQGLDQSHMRLMRVVMRWVLLVWLRADDISSLAGRHPSLPWPQCWGLVGNILWSQAQLLQPVSACTDHQRFYLRTGQAIHHPATTGVTTAAIIIVSHLTATQV